MPLAVQRPTPPASAIAGGAGSGRASVAVAAVEKVEG